jgi:MFS family permease
MPGYLAVLRIPGALRAFAPALVGRLAFAMVTLALLFAVQQSTGSFAAAGTATGAFGLANVIASPYRARFVDRRGQRLALNLLSISFAAGLCGVALVSSTPAPNAGLLITLAAVTGIFPPPLGAAMRVLWSTLTPPGPKRTRAYSMDAVCEELLFTTGPLITAAVIGASSPSTALLVTAVAAVAGTAGMTGSAASKTRIPNPGRPAAGLQPLRQPGFLSVLVALLAVGTVLGTVEVAAPAVAESRDSVGIAGPLLAAFAAGSAIGGLLYGQRAWRVSLTARLLVTATAMIGLCAAATLLPGVIALGFGLAAVGFFLAPSLVTGYLLADDLTSADVRTEASSWINTAVNAGAAVAAILVGVVVDVADPGLGFLLGAVVALALLAVAAPALIRRERGSPVPTSSPVD